MPRYRLSIAYDGSEFVGWQKQEPPVAGSHADESGNLPRQPLRSVQGVVEQAVREAVRQPVMLIGASRTDSGVHAERQTAAFTVQEQFTADGRRIGPPDDRLREAINARLPADVLVTACEPADPAFDPIKDCLCKGYRYSVWNSPDRPLWERGRLWHVRGELDADAMNLAASQVVGEHDFAAFAAAGHGRESTVRTVLSCRAWRDGSDTRRVFIEVSADGFLWNMVRIIAGTLVEVGRGKLAPESMGGVIATRDRNAAGPTAPAHGLCLMWGLYPGDPSDAVPAVDRAWLDQRERFVVERRAARVTATTTPVGGASA